MKKLLWVAIAACAMGCGKSDKDVVGRWIGQSDPTNEYYDPRQPEVTKHSEAKSFYVDLVLTEEGKFTGPGMEGAWKLDDGYIVLTPTLGVGLQGYGISKDVTSTVKFKLNSDWTEMEAPEGTGEMHYVFKKAPNLTGN